MSEYSVRHMFSSLLPVSLQGLAEKSDTFIETGTNLGAGVQAALDAGFSRVISIERDPRLFGEALDRYRGIPQVTLWCADSPDMLRELLIRQTTPCVIYLDAHSIDRNPLLQELDAIAVSPCKSHVILIDDVRMFGSADWGGLSKESALSRILLINDRYAISYRDTAHAKRDLLVAI